jgi:hypothetical protein
MAPIRLLDRGSLPLLLPRARLVQGNLTRLWSDRCHNCFSFLSAETLAWDSVCFLFVSLFLWDPMRLPDIQHIALRVPDLDHGLTTQRVRSVWCSDLQPHQSVGLSSKHFRSSPDAGHSSPGSAPGFSLQTVGRQLPVSSILHGGRWRRSAECRVQTLVIPIPLGGDSFPPWAGSGKKKRPQIGWNTAYRSTLLFSSKSCVTLPCETRVFKMPGAVLLVFHAISGHRGIWIGRGTLHIISPWEKEKK